MQLDTPWTPSKVAEALVRAFRRLPGHPVLSRGPAFVDHEDLEVASVAPLRWPERYVRDVRSRRILLTWARCIAMGESVRAAYEAWGWKRSTAEGSRKRALAIIADKLNAERT